MKQGTLNKAYQNTSSRSTGGRSSVLWASMNLNLCSLRCQSRRSDPFIEHLWSCLAGQQFSRWFWLSKRTSRRSTLEWRKDFIRVRYLMANHPAHVILRYGNWTRLDQRQHQTTDVPRIVEHQDAIIPGFKHSKVISLMVVCKTSALDRRRIRLLPIVHTT